MAPRAERRHPLDQHRKGRGHRLRAARGRKPLWRQKIGCRRAAGGSHDDPLREDFATCLAPQAAEDPLRAEGFTDIRYGDTTDAHVRRSEKARSGAVGCVRALRRGFCQDIRAAAHHGSGSRGTKRELKIGLGHND
jgi:hypothetical protein